ncbi:Spt4-domain-containing protein [Clathrospora elynae]|uniref:Transcription elongation factor SPT4 n=1 Tax=Clathrospora elynae TaxID=706981 RepID=A0A6A5T799_9PLEO|nr:Spt4-domain-containing protein [Clathrospora elynae]
MARKGVATVRPANDEDKYIYIDSDSDEISLASSVASGESSSVRGPRSVKPAYSAHDIENVHPAAARERLNFSNAPKQKPGPLRQPRQASESVGQSRTLAHALFPSDFDNHVLPSIEPADGNLARRTQNLNLTPPIRRRPGQKPSANPPPFGRNFDEPDTMIQGGAYIAPGQQRNMRACMVCSIVRTQQQFLNQGCPNCEEILELASNPEQINDCTSQVFEGLITVADTNRSWVARYQRLEGYVPGVYATQVEGILPDDIIGAVESAGINYVPRDGSEQEMLPKD